MGAKFNETYIPTNPINPETEKKLGTRLNPNPTTYTIETDYNTTPELKEEKTIQNKKTKEELCNLKDELVGTTLSEPERTEAFNLAQNLANNNLSKQWLEKYQKNHLLSNIDGKIGPETFNEMKAGKIFEKLDLNNDLNQKQQDEIINILKKELGGQNYFALTGFVISFEKKHKNNEKYKKFFQKYHNTMKEHPQINNPKNLQNVGDLGDDIVSCMDGKIECKDILKRNKGSLTVAGLLGFVVMGDKIPGLKKFPGMGNWFGRLLYLIVGGGFLGLHKPFIKGGEMLMEKVLNSNDHGLIKEVKENVKSSTAKTQKAASDMIDDIVEGAKGIKLPSITEAKNKLETSISTITSSISNYNNSFVDEKGKPKEGYIKPKKLDVLENLINDEKFKNTTNTDLANINNKNGLFAFLTEEGKTKINNFNTKNPKNQITNKDIENFTHKHLNKLFENNKNAETIKDTYLTASILNLLNENVLIGEYFKDRKINDEIITDLGELYNGNDPKISTIAANLHSAIKGNIKELEEFDINNYQLDKIIYKDQIEKFKDIKEKALKYKIDEKNLKTQKDEINKIGPKDENSVTVKNINEYLKSLEEVTFSSSSEYLVEEFKNAKIDRINKIINLAKNSNDKLTIPEGIKTLLGVTTTTITSGDILKIAEKAKEKAKEEKIATEIEKFSAKIDTLTNQLPEIKDEKIGVEKFNEIHKKFEEISAEFFKNNSEILIKLGFDETSLNLKTYINNLFNTNLFSEKTGLNKVDKAKKEKLTEFLKAFKEKLLKIENNFDFSKIPFDNKILNEVKEALRDFSKENKEIRQKEFKEYIFDEFTKPLIKTLPNSTKEALEDVKKSYEEITENLGDLVGDEFEEAYEEKLKELGKKELLKKKVKEIYSDLNAKKLLAPFEDFAEKYKNYEGTEIYNDIMDSLKNGDMKLVNFIATMKQTSLLSDSDIISGAHIKQEDVEKFKENLNDAIEDYEKLLNDSSFFVKIKYLFN